MPDDLAKKISELVNKKPYGPEDDLQDAPNRTARYNASTEADLLDWFAWLV